ncbi:DUF4179 domain-containing protein [Candidatus Clostridium stratigraminis]|uniref:DUF4179 domain-containing protein n=1 Tax=Candidatus Clostridium stratigraminis TaxID=3381661 RepID=A0ABW8T192_9CLOT
MNNDFDIFNDIVMDFDEYEQVNVTDLDTARIKKRFINKIKRNNSKVAKKNIIAASLVIAIASSMIFSNESVRAQINSIGVNIVSFFNKSDNDIESYTTKVVKSVTDKGVTFGINEVMLDYGQIIASLRIDSSGIDRKELSIEQNGDLNIIPTGITVFVDGKELVDRSGGFKMQYNDDGTVDILMTEDFNEVDLNKTYNVKFVCRQLRTQINGESNRIINGNWSIDFLSSGKAMADLIKTIPINKEISINYAGDEVNIFLKELRYSPYSVKLICDEHGPKEKMYMYGFTLFDESGNQFDLNSGGSIETGDSMYEYIIKNTTKKIKIIPHIYENKKMTFLKDNGVDVDLSTI